MFNLNDFFKSRISLVKLHQVFALIWIFHHASTLFKVWTNILAVPFLRIRLIWQMNDYSSNAAKFQPDHEIVSAWSWNSFSLIMKFVFDFQINNNLTFVLNDNYFLILKNLIFCFRSRKVPSDFLIIYPFEEPCYTTYFCITLNN